MYILIGILASTQIFLLSPKFHASGKLFRNSWSVLSCGNVDIAGNTNDDDDLEAASIIPITGWYPSKSLAVVAVVVSTSLLLEVSYLSHYRLSFLSCLKHFRKVIQINFSLYLPPTEPSEYMQQHDYDAVTDSSYDHQHHHDHHHNASHSHHDDDDDDVTLCRLERNTSSTTKRKLRKKESSAHVTPGHQACSELDPNDDILVYGWEESKTWGVQNKLLFLSPLTSPSITKNRLHDSKAIWRVIDSHSPDYDYDIHSDGQQNRFLRV